MPNATGLYRKLELHMQRRRLEKSTVSLRIFGCPHRMRLWANGHIPRDDQLKLVVDYLDRNEG